MLAKIWNKKTEKSIDLREVKLQLRNFFIEKNFQRNIFEITDVQIEEEKEKVNLKIILCNPSVLIGKKGELIKSLTIHLSNIFDKKFFVTAEESSLWK